VLRSNPGREEGGTETIWPVSDAAESSRAKASASWFDIAWFAFLGALRSGINAQRDLRAERLNVQYPNTSRLAASPWHGSYEEGRSWLKSDKMLRFALEELMRHCLVFACIAGLTALALAPEPAAAPKSAGSQPFASVSADSGLKDVFQAKIKAEWDALKNKDRKAYAELLADDYQGVEVDGQGERTKIQALNELANGNVSDYTLWGLKLIPLGPDATFVIYEVTLTFPPRSVVRFSRVYITELWVRRGGQWKELHYQETHVK